MNNVKFSVVIPVYNEEESILPLCFSLKKVMDRMGGGYEVIIVNDGSQDQSRKVLTNMDFEPADLIIIDIKERRGQSCALQAGFDIARGEVVITMDGDLQNDPDDIPRLLEKMAQGYEVVCGWRRIRHDPWAKRVAANIANYIRRIAFHEDVHDVGCTLRAYTAESIKGLKLYRHRHRFLTALLKKRGVRTGEVEVRHHFRQSGDSKYGIIIRLCSSIPDFFAILLEYHSRSPKSLSSNKKICKL